MAEAFAVIPIARRCAALGPAARSRTRAWSEPRPAVTVANALLRGRGNARDAVGGEALSAALGMVPAMVALSGSELASYHGVEHKAIAAYEQEPRSRRRRRRSTSAAART